MCRLTLTTPPGAEVEALFADACRCHDAGELAEANALYKQVIGRAPRHAGALHRLGAMALQVGEPQPAVDLISRAIAVAPHPGMFVDRAAALTQLDRMEEALADCGRATALDANNLAALYNRAVLLRRLGRTEEAIVASRAVVAAKPNFAMGHMHLAVCLLQTGQLKAGFDEYEWRKRTAEFVDPRYDLPSPWQGEPIAGRTLFIFQERFLGDVIHFCRYALLVEQAGGHVVLAVQRSLHALLRSLSPAIELLDAGDAPERFDYQCALLSLPRAFGAAIPPFRPYLAPQPEREARWRARIGGEGRRIGVCWQGSTLPYAVSLQRSFPPAELAPLAALDGVRLISLQKRDGLEQLASLPAGMSVESYDDADEGPDAFLDTAAIIAACDLVVTADTSVAHLAGAMGKTVWLALPALAEWRWGERGEATPWYPSMRLFRQATQGDWTGVFAAMAAALA